jgi:AAA+ superfamily predicted ATPase
MHLCRVYQFLLPLSCAMLLYSSTSIVAMDPEAIKQGYAMLSGLQQKVDALEGEVQDLKNASPMDPTALQQTMREFNELKEQVSALTMQQSSDNISSSPSDLPRFSTADNEQAKALKELNTTLEHIGYGIIQAQRNALYAPGTSEYQPLFTTEAKPGIMGMIADTIRQERATEFRAKTRELFDWTTKNRTQGGWLQDVAYMGALGLTIPMMAILGKKTIDTTMDILKHTFTTPAINILRPETKYGRMGRLKRWWNGYKTPAMIFDDSVKKRLEEIETVTKNIRDHIQKGTKKDVKYRNLLLYGKPGTGKTLFATILADKTDMDFLSVSAGDLLQSGAEGKKYFDDLVEMANRSKYGTIIFIDEADGLFIARDELLKAKALDHLVVLNHILGATGSGSDKFMLLAVTNNAYSFDPAMGRRFQDRVEMPLPNETTRVELLTLYIKDKLSKSTDLLTPEKIQTIAHRTAGLSHAELSDMVNAMSSKADTNKDGRLTEDNVESATEEAIEKMKAAEKDRLELERKTQGLPQPKMRKETVEEPAT